MALEGHLELSMAIGQATEAQSPLPSHPYIFKERGGGAPGGTARPESLLWRDFGHRDP